MAERLPIRRETVSNQSINRLTAQMHILRLLLTIQHIYRIFTHISRAEFVLLEYIDNAGSFLNV